MNSNNIFRTGLAALLCASLLAGCGGGSSAGTSTSGGSDEGTSDEKVVATVTVWGPQEDQSDDNGKWLQTECEKFAAEHPDWELTFNYGVCSEGDAKTSVSTDPSAAADVYMFANDQIPDLLKAGGIAELGGKTVDAIKAIGACGVVVAAGGVKIIPQVPGIEKTVTYEQVLTKEVNYSGKKIAVIGGGLTGLETAEYLSDFNNEVTVVEMASAVGTAMYRSLTASVVEHITKNGGHIMTGSMFKAVGDGTVTINDLASGFDKDYPFDAVVVAMGVRANDALVAEFEAAFDKVVAAGDVINPGNIADATHAGYDKGFVF